MHVPTLFFLLIRIEVCWQVGESRVCFWLWSKMWLLALYLQRLLSINLHRLWSKCTHYQTLENDPKDEICCLIRTKYSDQKVVCTNLKTNTDKSNLVVYRIGNNDFAEKTHLKLAEYKQLFAKPVYLMSCIDIFSERCFMLDKTTAQFWNIIIKIE